MLQDLNFAGNGFRGTGMKFSAPQAKILWFSATRNAFSKGFLHRTAQKISDPVQIAKAMIRGGAIGLSVLTQPYLFNGSPQFFSEIRKAIDVPLLMKDIIVDKVQIDAAQKLGADYILFIGQLFPDVNELEKKCYAAMDDDFNTPIVIAHLFDGVRIINSVKDGKEGLNIIDLEKMKSIFNTFVTDILGFVSDKESSGNDLTKEIMELVLKLRENAKTNKDFDSADLIREELNKLNIQVKDGRNGSSWEVKS